MGLIRCPVCSSQVSSSACQCPHCGHPISGEKTEATTGWGAIAVLGGLILSALLFFALANTIDSILVIIVVGSIPTVVGFGLASLRKR